MNDIGVVKTAYYMNNGVHFTDVGKKLVAQTFTFGGSLYQTCNVHELDDGRGGFF